MAVSYRININKTFKYILKLRLWGFLALVLLIHFNKTEAQSIVDKLDKASKSSINAYALNAKGMPIDTTRGFFISADGLAITSASIFQNGDTVIFTDEKDKSLQLHRIVAFHLYSNLALIQLKNSRSKEPDFLLPSKKTFESHREILAFTNNNDAEKGLAYGRINSIIRITFLGRCGNINIRAGGASECSPIMDATGDFIGIYYFVGSPKNALIIPISVINDENWVSVNQTWTHFKSSNKEKSRLTNPLFTQALIFQGQGKWLEAARSYTTLLKTMPDNAQVHALRSLTRFNYGNNVGAREDFTYSLNLDPNGYFPYYSRAQFYLNAKNRTKALEDLFLAIEKNPNFADAFLEIGRIQTISGDIKHAFASFTYALETDSLLADAWYERGRLYIQHSSNQEKALEDLTMASRLDPSLTGVYTLIGNIKFSRQNYLEAILDFDKAINQNGGDTHALMNRGMAFFNTGVKDKACADWERAGKQGHLQAFKLISRHCSELRKGTFTRNN